MHCEMVLRTPHGLHSRPALYVKTVCDLFPETEFKIVRGQSAARRKEVDPKSFMALFSSGILAGEFVELQVSGRNEALAMAFVKAAWETIRIEDAPGRAGAGNATELDQPDVRAAVYESLLEVSEGMDDPDKHAILAAARVHLMPDGVTTRKVAVLQRRFSQITAALLAMISRHYGCQIELMYEIGEQGIHRCEILPDDMGSFLALLMKPPLAGSKITVCARGDKSPLAARVLTVVLENLEECETWLRGHTTESDDTIVTCMAGFARGLPSAVDTFPPPSKARRSVFPTVQGFHSTHVMVDKELALRSLCEQLQQPTDVDARTLLKSVQDRERSMPTYLTEGLAIPHAVDLDIRQHTIALGVYSSGVPWDVDQNRAYLVFMSAVAKNAQQEYLAYIARLATMFVKHIGLRKELFQAQSADEANRILRAAEQAISFDD